MARIVKFHSFGSADVLKIENCETPEPKANEIRIKVAAIGLNRAEIVFRQGLYLERPALPSKIGYEASGIIDAIGPGVSGFKVGDKVSTIPAFSMSTHGVYGDVAVVPATAVSHYPAHLGEAEATSIWMQYLTAYGALIEFGHLSAGEHIVITAASSSVGLAAIEIANSLGAIPIATTRTADKKKALLEAGAKHVIVTDTENLVDRVMDITSKSGARVIFDPVAGPFVDTLTKAAAREGIIFLYGALSGEKTPFPLMTALQKALTLRGYTLFELTSDPKRLKTARDYVFNALNAMKLKPVVDKIFPLEEIVQAHKYMESNQQIGKIVVKV